MATPEHHLAQASHNTEFHTCIEQSFNGRFHDWKITVLFYTAIHYLKALAAKKGIHIGVTHSEIAKNINPSRQGPKMAITRNAWREYDNLFHYSQTARYNGITDFDSFEKLKQIDHAYCLTHLENFKKYIQGQGVRID